MAIYNCGYPIYHTISNPGSEYQDYSISTGGRTVYTGRIYFRSPSDASERIDLSPIFREYVDVLYEDISFTTSGVYNLPKSADGVGSITAFTVTDSLGTVTYNVIYNYNTEYIGSSPDSGDIREPITFEVDPRQDLFACGYSNVGTAVYSMTTSKDNVSGGSGASGAISGLCVNLSAYPLEAGDTVNMVALGTTITYNVVHPCKNRFALYYVNKYGGLEALLCSGRANEGWNRNDINVELYNDRLNRFDFEQKTLRSDIQHTFELRTGFVPEGHERYIDNVVNTTRCWLHDFDRDIIFSCQITDGSFTAEEKRYNKTLRYNFNVRESQKQLRR